MNEDLQITPDLSEEEATRRWQRMTAAAGRPAAAERAAGTAPSAPGAAAHAPAAYCQVPGCQSAVSPRATDPLCPIHRQRFSGFCIRRKRLHFAKEAITLAVFLKTYHAGKAGGTGKAPAPAFPAGACHFDGCGKPQTKNAAVPLCSVHQGRFRAWRSTHKEISDRASAMAKFLERRCSGAEPALLTQKSPLGAPAAPAHEAPAFLGFRLSLDPAAAHLGSRRAAIERAIAAINEVLADLPRGEDK